MTVSIASLATALLHHGQSTPDATAFEAVGDDGQVSSLNYGTLAARASRLAQQVRANEDERGEPALILHPPGLDYVVAVAACLLAGVPAVPAYPPEPHRLEVGLRRLRRIVDDVEPGTVLANEAIGAALDDLGEQWLAPRLVHEARDVGGDDDLALLDPHEPPGDPVALIQYTSGSTRDPRGVLVRRSNLEHNIAAIARRFELSPTSRGVIWLPPYHDMGLIGGIFTPLWLGFPVRLMSPLTFLKDPLLWLEQIGAVHATISGGPNFAYELCVRRAEREPARVASLSLASWSVAFNGAEPVRASTLRAFSDTFGACGFDPGALRPCYGLAEATLLVASSQWGGVPERDGRISCGPVLEDQRVEVVAGDPPAPLADGQEGEVWLSGPSVADGYRDQPDALVDWDGARWLRTGDLGYRIGTDLVITGRSKDLIIHQGQNFHAADLEAAAVGADPCLRPVAAAFSSEDVHGGETIVAIETRHVPDDESAVVASVRAKVLAECGIRVDRIELVSAGTIPRTSSGKVQRRACRDLLARRPDARTPRAPIPGPEQGLVAIVAGVLAACAGSREADERTAFLEMGGDSLRAAEAARVLEEAFAVPVTVECVLRGDAHTVATALVDAAAQEGSADALMACVDALRSETTRKHSSERTTA